MYTLLCIKDLDRYFSKKDTEVIELEKVFKIIGYCVSVL